jgi:hypothetical protein
VQRYVQAPALWDGVYKFHLRVYALLTADMRFFVYRKAFAHVANRPFHGEEEGGSGGEGSGGGEGGGAEGEGGAAAAAAAVAHDREAHITNVSQNIHDDGAFHGFQTVDLLLDFEAGVWPKLKRLFAQLTAAARPFLARQLGAHHFHHLGADVILDAAGTPWLIEVNAPPNMFCYTNDPTNVNERTMAPVVIAQMHDLITRFVLPPLARAASGEREEMGGEEGEEVRGVTRAEPEAGRQHVASALGGAEGGPEQRAAAAAREAAAAGARQNGWECVNEGEHVVDFAPSAPSDLPLNVLLWHAFCSRRKKEEAAAAVAMAAAPPNAPA